MEEDLSSKMKEFMSVLDQVKRYKVLYTVFPDLTIIITLSLVGVISVAISAKLALVFISNYNTWTPMASSVEIFLLIIGLVGGFLWITRKVASSKTGEWRETLSQGVAGALKLLQEIEWEDVFSQIRYAKLGFWLYGALKMAIYWLIGIVVFEFCLWMAGNALHFSVDILIVVLLPLIIVLALGARDLRKRFDQIGRLDSLLWELRWFESEFRRSNFKA